ncbi:MAG: pyruvate dehydrogenase complex dihydrolipoamide acetyltransferase [Chlamydiae bacterium CG10_big_fil_rev_8_21_14_0_10_35_9]|nr:MAG: pyruvate dehydrogenase complex dihydrolipoamide acetyltransferase [Chlamydiae bacterium CG10_big_fil_rev_8_21_14_0_10_35_9]
MPFTVTMPKLSPTMEEGTIAKWHAKEGDKVEAGSLLIEVTTDKATVEHNALDEGYLRKIIVAEGDTAKVNQPIAIFTETADESIEDVKLEPEEKKEEKPDEEEKGAEEIREQKPKEKEPTKPAMAQPSFIPYPPVENYEFKLPSDFTPKAKATPLAKKIAREKGLDLSSVKGSGPNERITSKDLDLAQPQKNAGFLPRKKPSIAPGSYTEEPLTPMRKAIGTRLQQSKTFIPHFYVGQEVNVDALINLREQLKNLDIKVTFNDFVIKAVALALKEHPHVNTGFNSETQSIIHFETIDISVAVTIEGGLITPIIRHADYKNLGEISQEVKSLAKKAKDNKLQPHEFQGGSFTISNLGMFGVSDFVAVINPPQAAILAIGGIEKKPVVKENQIVISNTMFITLSVDHRVVDGADAAQFIKTVQKYLENPAGLIL